MGGPAQRMGWRPRDACAAAFFLSFLAAMIAIPLFQLRVAFGTREIGRFGWQMYARDHRHPTFVAYDADGRASPVRSRFALTWWGDFGYREALVRDMCNQTSGAVRIEATKDFLVGFREDYPCR